MVSGGNNVFLVWSGFYNSYVVGVFYVDNYEIYVCWFYW